MTTADPVRSVRRLVDKWRLSADPDDLDARLAGAADALAKARQTGDGPLLADAWRMHLVTLLEAERLTDIYVSLGELDEWCETRGDRQVRRVRDWMRGLRAVLDGDPALAERLLTASVSPREALGPTTTIRWFQGRFHELEARYLELRRDEPTESVHVLMLAWIWAEQHRTTAARGVLETLGDIEALPRDRDWLLRMSVLAEISVLLADRSLAERVWRILSPYPKRLVLIGDGFGCWGTTDRPLGLLSRFLGRIEDAIAHFTAKLELSSAAGAQPWLVRGQFDLAELLLDVDDSRRGEALRYAREGIAAAHRLDYPLLRDRAEQLAERLRTLQAPQPASDRRDPAAPSDPQGTAPPQIVVLGGFQARSSTGELVLWESRKARDLLGILTASRGRSVSREYLMEHLWPGQMPSRLRNRLAVALSTIRRALDPIGAFDRDRFVSATRDTVRLRLDNVIVDAERYLRDGAAALAAVETQRGSVGGTARDSGHDPSGRSHVAPPLDAHALLSHAVSRYHGAAFADEPFAEWAFGYRDECAAMQIALLHAMIDTTPSEVCRADSARRILVIDQFDERANDALADALHQLGARGLAEATRHRFRASLA